MEVPRREGKSPGAWPIPSEEGTDMPSLRNEQISEAREDVLAVRDSLREALPVMVSASALVPSHPDTLLAEPIRAVAEAIGRLDAAAGLLTEEWNAPCTC
jgi:hypothetical protein